MPQRLEQLEMDIEALQAQVSDAGFFSRPHSETQQVLADLATAEQALEQAFARWEELEAMKKRLIGKQGCPHAAAVGNPGCTDERHG
ncbi:ABC transporter ATPase component [Serratia fonticola]|uniref:ABC transporter ATPase component n=1 Tax=Serratia fonticola TaxID=47917 RepID=A0A4U9V8P2_SERFO|nr:ABC transporter ATPase component [Serratia fonticola]